MSDKKFTKNEAKAFIKGLELASTRLDNRSPMYADVKKLIDIYRRTYKLFEICPTCGKSQT